jgi:hypothetical protein
MLTHQLRGAPSLDQAVLDSGYRMEEKERDGTDLKEESLRLVREY